MHNTVVEFPGATIVSESFTAAVATCRIRTLDPKSGEVTGHFELPGNAQIPRGLPYVNIKGPVLLEIKLISSVLNSDGQRRYRFMALCPPEAVSALDLMMNPSKHPTVLEDMMY
jgi:hypothetical protein